MKWVSWASFHVPARIALPIPFPPCAHVPFAFRLSHSRVGESTMVTSLSTIEARTRIVHRYSCIALTRTVKISSNSVIYVHVQFYPGVFHCLQTRSSQEEKKNRHALGPNPTSECAQRGIVIIIQAIGGKTERKRKGCDKERGEYEPSRQPALPEHVQPTNHPSTLGSPYRLTPFGVCLAHKEKTREKREKEKGGKAMEKKYLAYGEQSCSRPPPRTYFPSCPSSCPVR